MALRARFTARARADLIAIEAYLGPINPGAAGETLERLASSIRFLCEHPMAAPESIRPGVRVHMVPRTRYLVVYRPAIDWPEVLRVLHQAQSRTY